jgi:D-3-phosphoglycerate dehydrogenase / 2-oxoglutarate reductase
MKGMEIDYYPNMPYQEVCDVIGSYDGVIINSKVICDSVFLDSASHLDFIGRLGSGLDIIDLPYAKQLGIAVISSPEGNANAVAEHALGMLLSLLHRQVNAVYDVKAFDWNREPNRGTELRGSTIGLIGYGHTGPAFAEKLRGMDVTIIAYDKYQPVKDAHVSSVSLEHLLKVSDVVSIHLPLTSETHMMAEASFFSSMKKGAIIINTSRGLILDSQALLDSLESGHLSGACLDVIENEKPDQWTESQRQTYTRLLAHEDVLITPHIAGWTHQSLLKIASILFDKICKFYRV